jgi:hypothetical protein
LKRGGNLSKNRFSDSRKKDRSLLVELLLPIAFFLVIAGLFVWNLGSIDRATEVEALTAVNQAITRAAVQCYAIEGRYPASVEYMENNYGLSIDRERYIVHYERFAENLMPDIRVLSIADELEE